MKTSTKTNTVTNTHIAVATLAVVAATAVALVVAPAQNSQSLQVAQAVATLPGSGCVPTNMEFLGNPCQVRVRGRVTGSGYARARYSCPGSSSSRRVTMSGVCRTENALRTSAARSCERRNQCAVPAEEVTPPVNASSTPEVFQPVVSWATDTPCDDSEVGCQNVFSPNADSIVGKVVIQNPNNQPMSFERISPRLNLVNYTLSSDYLAQRVEASVFHVSPTSSERFWLSSNWWQDGGLTLNINRARQFQVPPQESRTFVFTVDTNYLSRGATSTGSVSFVIPSDFLSWKVGDKVSDGYIYNSQKAKEQLLVQD